MEKRIYFTPWEGVDVSTEVSLFDYGFIMRRQRGTNMWQMIVRDQYDSELYCETTMFDPDGIIRDCEDGTTWMDLESMRSTHGYDSVGQMIARWKESPVVCFQEVSSSYTVLDALGDMYAEGVTEKEIRKRLGRAIH